MKFIPILFALLLPLAAKKPNIILIYTDDHGWPDIGPAGIYKDLKTPHLDALAASGVRATNGYSSAPQCVPSRAGLLIGKYQNRFGVESNKESLDGFNKELTIAARLKKVGYTDYLSAEVFPKPDAQACAAQEIKAIKEALA